MTNPTHIPSDYDVVHAMRQHGGGFMKRLADAWLVADETNRQRIANAFAPEFASYRQAARFQAMNEQLSRDVATGFNAVTADERFMRLVHNGIGRN